MAEGNSGAASGQPAAGTKATETAPPTGQPGATSAATEPKAATPDPEVSEKLKRLEALEKAEAEREKAKLSDQQKLEVERAELRRGKFELALERGGVPAELAALVAVPEKGDPDDGAKVFAKAFEKAVKAEVEKRTKAAGEGGTQPPATGMGGTPRGSSAAAGAPAKTNGAGDQRPAFRSLTERAAQPVTAGQARR